MAVAPTVASSRTSYSYTGYLRAEPARLSSFAPDGGHLVVEHEWGTVKHGAITALAKSGKAAILERELLAERVFPSVGRRSLRLMSNSAVSSPALYASSLDRKKLEPESRHQRR